MARFLGSTNYGQIAIALVPVSIATLFSDLGVKSALIKFISQYRHEKKNSELPALVYTGLIINSAIGLILSLTVFLLAGFIAQNVFRQAELTILIQIMSFNIFAVSLVGSTMAIFVGYEKMLYRSVINITYSVLKAILAPLLVILGHGPIGAALGQTVPELIAGIVGLALVFKIIIKKDRLKAPEEHFQIFKTFLRYGYPLFLSTLLTGGLTQLFNFLLALYATASLIGNYNAAINFGVLVSFMTLPIATALFPLYSKLTTKNNDLKLIYEKSVKYLALLTLPVVATLIALSDPMINVIYSNSYEAAAVYLSIYSLSFLTIGLGSISQGDLLNSQGRTDINLRATMMNLVVGVPLGFLLISSYGVLGLLIVQLTAPNIGFFYSFFWIRRNWKITIQWKTTAKLYAITAMTMISAYVLTTSLTMNPLFEFILGGGVIAVLYITLLPITRTIDSFDIKEIRKVIGIIKPIQQLAEPFLTIMEKIAK